MKGAETSEILLDVQDLKTHFFTEEGVVKAVNGVSFQIPRGKSLGLVGESGCGKSVTSLSIMRLIPTPPGRIVAGEIRFEGRNLLALPEGGMRRIRGNEISMIFQEPMTSLNPVFTIGNQITEAIQLHQKKNHRQALELAEQMLHNVSIPDPGQRLREYPHQLSGGMRQRAMIAMALSCDPALLIADEPTTALDVTIQAQILDLLAGLKEKFSLSLLLITHDLGVVAEVADQVAVMYAGKIVEEASTRDIFKNARHPYTVGLLRSIPKIHLDKHEQNRLETIEGTVPNLAKLPPGCSFADRCQHVMPACRANEIPLFPVGENHQARCLLYQ